MFQREAGYDPENKDWFYAVYAPNGNVVVNPLGMNMARRIAAGLPDDVPFGCIACHKEAPGGDFVFLHDAIAVR
jgi:hypothetical protein